ncbi:MAG: hypothetical protein WCP69_04035 [Bacteroidota bacterium]
MKRLCVIFVCIIIFDTNLISQQICKFEDETIKCIYERTQGRIDGKYVSYYKNGEKKAEGFFRNNYRNGLWSVWDSTGKLRMQRNYTDPFTFKRIIPVVPKDKPIELLNIPQYRLSYNDKGFIDYYKIKEINGRWTKVVYRYLTPQDNPLLFKNDLLFKIFTRNIELKKVPVYNATDEYFEKESSITIDISNFKVIAYKLNEVNIFDDNRFVLESRLLGILPVAINKQTNDTVDLFLIYFPEIREFLAQEKIKQTDLPEEVKSYDDLFFFRYYYGQIYKEANATNKSIAEYKTGEEIKKEAERIEIEIIEYEHDTWIGYTKQ